MGASAPSFSQLSRRQAIGLGASAAVAAGLSKHLSSPGKLEVETGAGRVAFRLGGQERWVVDARRFAGTPRVDFSRDDDHMLLTLTSARYPGTDLDADLRADIRQTAGGWHMRLEMRAGAFSGEVPFEDWLLGASPLKAHVGALGTACALDPFCGVHLDGPAEARFFPDWRLRLTGPGVAHLGGFGGTAADSVEIALLGEADPSLVQRPISKRSRISLWRGANVWPEWPQLRAISAGRLVSAANPFTAVHVETSETSRLKVRRALLAESSNEGEGLFFQPSASLFGGGGEPFRLPLRNVRYAVSYDAHGDESAIIARFGEPTWLHGGGVGLLIGDPGGPDAFELLSARGSRDGIAAAPAVLRIATSMPDAVVGSIEPSSATSLVFEAHTAAATDVRVLAPQPGVREHAVLVIPLSFTISVLRPLDLLVLGFSFINLKLVAGPGQHLERIDPTQDACVIVHFQPQNIVEEAFFEADNKKSPADPPSPGSEPLKLPPVGSRLAGPSRLAFKLPASTTSIPFTIEGLLNWTGFEQKVVSTALPPPARQIGPIDQPIIGVDQPIIPVDQQQVFVTEPVEPPIILPPPPPPEIHEPAADETAIEAPWRVILSPNKFAAWAHSPSAVTRNGRTELWHTRLGVRNNDGTPNEESEFNRTVRAVWSPGFVKDPVPLPTENPPPPVTPDNPFRHSLTPYYRWNFVRLSADFTIPDYEPRPINVERMMLSSLGAWLNVRAVWPETAGTVAESLAVASWQHRAAMGRDFYVRVVVRGYYAEIGHKASRVIVTERKFQSLNGEIRAYLRQRTYIITRELEKTYPAPGQEHSGRQLPYTKIRLATIVTPNLDKPEDSEAYGGSGVSAFWPRVGGQDYQFHLIGTDADGQPHEFTSPLIFVREDVALNEATAAQVRNAYNTASLARRKRPMHGQKIAFAPSTPASGPNKARPGDTAHETVSITRGAAPPATGAILPFDQPRFYPKLVQAEVRLQAAEQVSGNALPGGGTLVEYPSAYLDDAFAGANDGAIYLKLVGNKALGFGADKAGGVLTPNVSISGLSRKIGVVGGDLDTFRAGNFKPDMFFQGATAKILGGIELFSVIQQVLNFTAGDEQKIPKLTNRTIYPDGNKNKPPEAIETTLSWKPEAKNAPLNVLVFNGDKTKSVSIEAVLLTKLDPPSEPTFEIVGTLTDFDLNLFGDTDPLHFITIEFKKLTFTAKTNTKANVDVDIGDVTFHGALELINELQAYLKTVTGGTGPSIDVRGDGITASVSVGLPTIAVGVFSMQNIAILVGLNIPFDGTPVRLRFAFCERENPFILTVSLFGGGGFVGLAIGADGVELVEMSLEFGANISIDIGVASGGVYLMAGVYIKVEGGEVVLTGYVRMGGSLEVLGIITISCEFYMGLTYESATDTVWGQASLTVEVEVLFFSASVTMSVERTFAGSTHAFKFIDLVPLKKDWDDYCEAFAA